MHAHRTAVRHSTYERTRVHTASLFRGEGRGVKRISRFAVIADSLPRSGGGGGWLAEGYMAGM